MEDIYESSLRAAIARLLVFTVLAAALVTADRRFGVVAQVRGYAAAATEAVFDAAAVPAGFGQWLYGAHLDREELLRRNAQLRRANVLLRAQMPRHEFLENENRRLRRLLLDADGGPSMALFAELAPVNLSRSAEQKIILSRGRADNVFPGQLALDAFGVVGQVTAAGLRKSTVTLLTDSSHSVPVQVARNGLQAVVYGGGVRGALNVPHLSQQADIKEGDLLVTSGLGRRFPAGHPVARVVSVLSDDRETTLTVAAAPVAQLDYLKEVVLLHRAVPESPATTVKPPPAAGDSP